MHIPSERIRQEMNSELASLWYVPANDGEELAVLIKAPTSCIKALISGCSLNLFFGKKDTYLCIGAQIMDIPDTPFFIASLQRESEEHISLIRLLTEREFPLFLFNEMDVCLAWTNVALTEEDASNILNLIGSAATQYVGSFTDETSRVLDCFCNSAQETGRYPYATTIDIRKASTALEPWRINTFYFYGTNEHYSIKINEKNEGEVFERAIWASLISVFPLALHKSPQVKIGEKMRELTDVCSFYTYGSFFIEAKDVSILNAGYHRDQARRIAGVQKQIRKAIVQLVGASKAFAKGAAIFDSQGRELEINREQPPHCIILITELIHWGDWNEIEDQLIKAMKQTRTFFHLLDLCEFIALLKGSSGKAELFDYNLMQRCKLFWEKRSIFIRSEFSAK